jgi:hypothetical protein
MWSGHKIMESWYVFKADNVTRRLLTIQSADSHEALSSLKSKTSAAAPGACASRRFVLLHPMHLVRLIAGKKAP